MDLNEEDVVIACAAYIVLQQKKKKNKKRYWVHKLFTTRDEEGEFHTIFGRLRNDQEKFVKYFRMSYSKFDNLLQQLKPHLTKKNSKWRKSISAEERLALTLRYLASGNSQISMSFSYRISPTAVHSIIVSTCEAIWDILSPQEMPQPTEEMWKKISEEFYDLWRFPNSIGALDGKHVVIQAPPSSGSLFYNYKHTFSIVLLALVDAKYRFIAVDVGGYGKSSDGGLFSRSVLGRSLENKTLNIPGPKPLPNCNEPVVPYVILGDEAFPLKTYLMRPYPGSTARSDERQANYNFRQSRTRRVVENAFGIAVQRHRVLYGRLHMHPENAEKVVLAVCVLHNYLLSDLPVVNDYEDNRIRSEQSLFTALPHVGVQGSFEATRVRETFREYFMNDKLGP
ncbi:putative nuclease HARBI1 [Anabrus simplex]|uniref:putative nuclease HARBI1 n=1 Tax=Anabrus simplex TaxID=316456 RepID=UPI0035A368BB